MSGLGVDRGAVLEALGRWSFARMGRDLERERVRLDMQLSS